MEYQPKYKYVPPFELHPLTKFYDFILLLAGFGKKFRQKILGSVKIYDSYQIVDIGCGTGVFLELLKKNYPSISAIGIDPDEQALSIASKRLNKYQNIKLIKSFAEALPLADESMDIVFSTLAFHHMPDDIKLKAIGEIYRVLKIGGQLIIVDFGSSRHPGLYRFITFWEPYEYLRGNLNGLIPWFMKDAGFKNIEIDSLRWPIIHLTKAIKT
jgi:ubiquinone/menaquinone biosynthesis C-methylase UbiE